jgi:hypothetical protein
LALVCLGFWLSLTYWVWGLIPVVGAVYLAAVVITGGLILETFHEIFGGATFDWRPGGDERVG